MAITAAEQRLLAELNRPGSEAARFSRLLDVLVGVIVFFAVVAAVHVHVMLTIGDWDFWVDWKDRQYWVTISPVLMLWLPAAIAYALWEKFRLPIAFTLAAVAVMFGEWMSRIFGFHTWSYYPFSMIWPAVVIPGMLCVDLVMMLTRNVQLTAIIGGFLMGLLFFPANWPLLAPFHLPVNQDGQMVSVADLVGYVFQRTSTPEYIRIIERGTLRTFGSDSTGISAFTAGVFCMLSFFVWWWIGSKVANLGYMPNRLKGLMGFREEPQVSEDAQ